MKEAKDQLIKARCTRTMKVAVVAAAGELPGDNNDESDVVRIAVEEYLTKRGYLTSRIAEKPSSYHTVAALEKAAKKLSGMKKRQAAKKSAA